MTRPTFTTINPMLIDLQALDVVRLIEGRV